ncbi:MAG: class I SAM-dependent methyltransferase [Candidatus Electryonea clarkiae]|nr:class I SAM-dependent methyltransferase [Candidatus Electryonea clarkiae]MDP8285173.1 class I SAM-dependent methyltransferase [Candidatus Electryonea clarkiae]
MNKYYAENLDAQNLKECYDIAPPRVRQYLDAELDFVLQKIKPGDQVLELGCGYGRILQQIASRSNDVVGIDNSMQSLMMAHESLGFISNITLLGMDAERLAFPEGVFDVVICIQNGISAFKINPSVLINESWRVTKPGGYIIFSSYSDKFWHHRIEWFERQSKAGMLGEIDWIKTRNGIIECKDGFRATTFYAKDFEELTTNLNAEITISEVDDSSLFCVIRKIKAKS